MKNFVFLTISALLLLSCNKKKKCEQGNVNEGIIVQSIGEFCYNTSVSSSRKGVVINDDSTYISHFSDTSTCKPIEIDFEKLTLLGLTASGGGCDVTFQRNVQRLNSEEKYQYKITVHQCGNCYMLGTSRNFVTVPKLPQGWHVTFEVEEIQH